MSCSDKIFKTIAEAAAQCGKGQECPYTWIREVRKGGKVIGYRVERPRWGESSKRQAAAKKIAKKRRANSPKKKKKTAKKKTYVSGYGLGLGLPKKKAAKKKTAKKKTAKKKTAKKKTAKKKTAKKRTTKKTS